MRAVRVIIFCMLTYASIAAAGQPRGEDLALCVGVGGYPGEAALATPARDAHAMATALETGGNYRKIVVLAEVDSNGQPNQERFLPTSKNIADMLRLLARAVAPDANLVVFL